MATASPSLLADVVLLIFYIIALNLNGLVILVELYTQTNLISSSSLPKLQTLSIPQLFFRNALRAVVAWVFYFPIIRICGRLVGRVLIRRSNVRREMILSRVEGIEQKAAGTGAKKGEEVEEEGWEKVDKEKKEDDKAAASSAGQPGENWRGIIGFFHPFCNAGGGGERVLWAAIRETQQKYPKATCIVYTGDHDASKQEILDRVKKRFNIDLNYAHIYFLYLSTRRFVLASTWPRFTLLGQSIGSIILAFDAFSLLVPDIFIDTMGYAFALGTARFCFPQMPTGAYVHYPTISTDMLESLDANSTGGASQGLNAGAGKGTRGAIKKQYWHIFAGLYSRVGGSVDVVMANSSWTKGHIEALWGPARKKNGKDSEVTTVYPPCPVVELERANPVDAATEPRRHNSLVCIAQFRPEKNHTLLIEAFDKYIASGRAPADAKLVLVGSVRDDEDSKRVYELRLLAREMAHIKDKVEFVLDAPWPEMVGWLNKCSVGVNGMWNEHFGIGVVEYQAAGLISVVNDTGGPKMDIVIDYDGGPTGYHASTAEDYAEAFEKALALPADEKVKMRLRAQASARRFNEESFARGWLEQASKLVDMNIKPKPSASPLDSESVIIGVGYMGMMIFQLSKMI